VKTLLVVWHSATGGTQQMADAAARAATDPDITVRQRHARDATAADLLNADGYIFATPENLAAMAGIMKDFFDRTYYAALDRLSGRPYAALICAGSDGENTARQIGRIATGWRLRPIAPPLIIRTNAQTKETIEARKTIDPAGLRRCEELGATMAAGLAAGIF
jgi:multimeric flavodoxin WrbA